ncbi:MAG: acyl--CoA ligase [Candidatus Tectomicrobia bacterium]|uniref:Acyl--CoA ligase n=1 Tax=Tectimicrobiota bacterium TaxID=2528274 RepID=A0A932GM59_UNCTE|nr:acyl--CoA ligase [Candidatus Tectomicrobia bacterium]
MEWYNETITGAVAKVVEQNPNAEAAVRDDQRVTYEELVNRASRIASGMKQLGITSGEHIAILHPNDIVVQVLHYASNCLGTVCVPINAMLSPRELSHILAHADVKLLFVGGMYKDKPLAEVVLEAIPELRQARGPNLDFSGHPKLKWVVRTEPGDLFHRAFLRLNELEQTGAKNPLPFVNQEAKPESISHLLYTSGSTAFPKGVLLTHRGILGAAFYWGEALGLTSADRCLTLLPYYHTAGLIVQWLDVHLRGGCVHILKRYHPIDFKEVMETVQRERITVMGAFDPLLKRILEHPERSQYDHSSWQKTSSFAGVSYDIRVKAGLSRVVCLYSLTEASNPVTLMMPEEKRYEIRRNSVGRPLPGVEVKIVAPDTEKELPPGVSGEIRFRGWNRMVGYYKPGPEETPDNVFDQEGFFKTGDRGYLDNEGYLYLQGRYKEMIKSGGENIFPLEVENFLCNEVPGIVLAQVVGVSDDRWGEVVTAFVEVAPGMVYTPPDIINICKEKMASFKVPKHVFFMESEDWPMTSTAKVRKDELQRKALRILACQEDKT